MALTSTIHMHNTYNIQQLFDYHYF